jgi:lipoprotein NlpD
LSSEPSHRRWSWGCYARLGLAIVALGLGACANRAAAPVSEQGKPLRQPESEYRDVVAGDTLYSIAWESGRDYRELATWNGIAPPFTIKPGQKIRLYPSTAAAAKTAGPALHTVQKGETLFSIATRYDVLVADLAAWNRLAAPYTIKPGQSLRVVAPAEGVEKPDTSREAKKPLRKTDTAPVVAATRASAPASNFKAAALSFGPWTWPTEGSLLARSNTGGASKGIDVGGKAGQPIVAAAPGTVVYQGSGLRGYGQLIIVKHNTDFLSAYAHCDKIVVREGNVIKRGQKIAEMGSTGTDRVKLHFEIRYRGTPVDPLDFLPKK